MNSAVGRNFDSLAANWNTPGFWSGELKDYTYVADASEWMTDAELETNLKAVTYRYNFFSTYPYSNETERNNLNTVSAGYNRKKLQYENIILMRAAPEVITTDPVTQEPTVNEPIPDGSEAPTGNEPEPVKRNWTPYIIIAGIVSYFIYKSNNKRKS